MIELSYNTWVGTYYPIQNFYTTYPIQNFYTTAGPSFCWFYRDKEQQFRFITKFHKVSLRKVWSLVTLEGLLTIVNGYIIEGEAYFITQNKWEEETWIQI